MNKLQQVTELLRSKYNVEMGDYFKLTEENREEVAEIIFSYYKHNIEKDGKLFYLYEMVLADQINRALDKEEYERLDVLTRVRNILYRTYPD